MSAARFNSTTEPVSGAPTGAIVAQRASNERTRDRLEREIKNLGMGRHEVLAGGGNA
jgi:hypothetical protein